MQDKPKPLPLTPEQEARARAKAAQREAKPKLTEENLLVAEFGLFYGFEAVQAVLNDEIGLDEVLWLVESARAVDSRNQYNFSAAVFTAVASANDKHPSAAFKKNTAHYLRAMRASA